MADQVQHHCRTPLWSSSSSLPVQTPSRPRTPSQLSRPHLQAAVGGACYRCVHWTFVNAAMAAVLLKAFHELRQRHFLAPLPMQCSIVHSCLHSPRQSVLVEPIVVVSSFAGSCPESHSSAQQPSRQILAVYSFDCCTSPIHLNHAIPHQWMLAHPSAGQCSGAAAHHCRHRPPAGQGHHRSLPGSQRRQQPPLAAGFWLPWWIKLLTTCRQTSTLCRLGMQCWLAAASRSDKHSW